MKKIKETTIKNNGIIYVAISLAVVGLLAIGVTVNANQTFKQLLADSLAKVIAPNVLESLNISDGEGDVLGAMPGSTWPSDCFNVNGLETCVKRVQFNNSTNTLACIKEPFNATSTVTLSKLFVTSYSTTTFAVNVGTSTVSTGLTTTTLASNGLNIMTIPTITGTSTGFATNDINVGVAGTYAAGSVSKMSVNPGQYVCAVAGEGDGGSTVGVTNASNTLNGELLVVFEK
jgi:hypothetical protein